ncbi:MAG: 50S ribosomal protein L6 [Chloroflexi bacterium]|nr:50S ribosomal protein L6 [Chloroflexota bacterium]MCL5950510.1 50S ribosomal protein L6 [Chloroflexota bacterium]
MSRVGRMPIKIPKGVQVKVDGSTVTVKGPKGELTQSFNPNIKVAIEDSTISVSRPDNKAYDALHGLTRALINNMVTGVTEGFRRNLEIEGVGYRAEVQGKNLVLSLGFSHPVPFEAPPGVSFAVDKSLRALTVEGVDRELVGRTAARIRAIRPPEPYKGKGIHYQGERVRRKAGKAGKVGAK